MSTGLVAGRFMAPHAGHQLLVETALALADRLIVLLIAGEDDPVPAAVRLSWLRALFPSAMVRIGEGAEAVSGEGIDLVFAGDERAAGLARALGARLVLLDPEHEAVGVRTETVLADPWRHWEVLARPARGHFARSICLHGPESTGKSTLAARLARELGTVHVPEYGRTYCEQFGLDLAMGDLIEIGRTQAAMGEAARRICNRRLILDTDPLMTAAWAQMLFGRRDPWFDAFDGTADLYLLLDIDMPWIDDGTRFFGDGERRRLFFDLSRAELDRRGLPYEIIGGAPEERFERAMQAIEAVRP